MDLVHDVDLEAAARGRVLDVLAERPDVVDAACWRRASISITSTGAPETKSWQDGQAPQASAPGARGARSSALARSRAVVVLPTPRGPGEEIGVRDAPGRERVLQRARDRILPDDRVERLRPPLPRQHLIGHRLA